MTISHSMVAHNKTPCILYWDSLLPVIHFVLCVSGEWYMCMVSGMCSFLSCVSICTMFAFIFLITLSLFCWLVVGVCARGIIVAYEIETINFAHIEWKVKQVLFIFMSISLSWFHLLVLVIAQGRYYYVWYLFSVPVFAPA